MSSDDERLAALEERLERLEQRLPDDAVTAAGSAAVPGAGPDDAFWLLREFERQGLDAAVVYGGVVPPEAGGPVSWQITREPGAVLDTDWSSSAAALAALGHPSRLQVLQLVARGEARTAAELAAAPGLGTTGQVYHHLRQLVAAGWLEPTARGQHRVPAERLVPLLVVLSAAGTSGTAPGLAADGPGVSEG